MGLKHVLEAKKKIIEFLNGDSILEYKTFQEFFDLFETAHHYDSLDNDEVITESDVELLKEAYEEIKKERMNF